jgi:hypothetical protein
MTDLPRVCFPLISGGIDSVVPQYKTLKDNNYSKVLPIFSIADYMEKDMTIWKMGKGKNEKYTRFEVFKELYV